jgi:serine/threonine protein kinase
MDVWLDDSTLAHLRDVAEWPDLGERYELRGRLGRGGMSVVYAAHDRVLNRDVAIKVLDDAQHVRHGLPLLSEARVLAQLEHPGIVPVHDSGTLPDGRVFYVMKLVRGERLDTAVESRSLNERLDLYLRICDAVSFAHARGIVHCDLKPTNIMLGAFGEVLVMDWGIAHVAARGLATAQSTVEPHDRPEPDDAPVVAGTPGYMAPEQQSGTGHVDQRADVFALGVILDALIPAPAPRPLAAIARCARAAHADDRYDSVKDLARDVMRFRDGEPVQAYRESLVERLGRIYTRHKVPIVLVLVYMIVRVILLLWFRT